MDEPDVDEEVFRAQSSVREMRYVLVVMAWILVVAIFIWTTFVVNLRPIHGYPSFHIPPSPGPFVSTRYDFPWWMVYLLGLSALNPTLLLFSMYDMSIKTRADWHRRLAAFLALLCGFNFVMLWVGVGCFFCNAHYSGESICNDPRYCGVWFSYNRNLCDNTNAGALAGLTDAQLVQDKDFKAQWIFALVFAVLHFVLFSLNNDARSYGAW
jgi:hypothetical protein